MSTASVLQAKNASALKDRTETRTAKRSKVNNKWRPLKPGFQPGPFDVICARGKDAREHIGNRRMRLTIDVCLDRYRAATTKHEKSNIVWHIVDTVRAQSPEGGFVKRDNGRWYEVGDHWAREKIGQSFRDRLHMDYKSSSKAKTVRKRMANIPGSIDVQKIAGETVNKHILKVSKTISGTNAAEISRLLVQANKAMLEDMKAEAAPVRGLPRSRIQQEPDDDMTENLFAPPPVDLDRNTSNLFVAPEAVAPVRRTSNNCTFDEDSSDLVKMPILRSAFSRNLAPIPAPPNHQQQEPNFEKFDHLTAPPRRDHVQVQLQSQTGRMSQEELFEKALKSGLFDPIPLSSSRQQRQLEAVFRSASPVLPGQHTPASFRNDEDTAYDLLTSDLIMSDDESV